MSLSNTSSFVWHPSGGPLRPNHTRIGQQSSEFSKTLYIVPVFLQMGENKAWMGERDGTQSLNPALGASPHRLLTHLRLQAHDLLSDIYLLTIVLVGLIGESLPHASELYRYHLFSLFLEILPRTHSF